MSLITENPIENSMLETFSSHITNQFSTISFKSNPEYRVINLENISQDQMNEVLNEAVEFLQNEHIFIDKIEKIKPTINDLFIEEDV